ncbi:hypothetical protein [Plantibacter sp. ME-Dv--P-095]|uniref:hypothetical protein n=1 Tax=Plantibacter sp. ME-Dv--P-095 TaxID=3040299 RepID=UPI00254B9791|nr:hypothetical protein [Plantibacter sp. ME-Dv--P-095]
MLRDAVGVLLAEGLELVASSLVEILGGDVRGNLRVIVARTDRLELERDALLLRQLTFLPEGVAVTTSRRTVARPQFAAAAP